MPTTFFRRTLLTSSLASIAISASADSFNRVSSFPVANNLSDLPIATETSAEIITASEDGNTLIYSDSPLGGVGFINIKDIHNPKPAGFLTLNGEPTSVATFGNWLVAGVNTSEDYINPNGYLAIINLATQKVAHQCELGGQPDSVAFSKDGNFVAVAIENERDEDLNDGDIPQQPAGFLSIIDFDTDQGKCSKTHNVSLTGLADIAGSDPEPEFVDFNDQDEVVVTLQENNHIVIVNAQNKSIIKDFSAGTVDLKMIDTVRDGALIFSGSQTGVRREPDAVKWLDNDRFVIANEGDYKGGARGFTIFSKQGDVLFESGASFEHAVVKTGHYPEKRSGKKGAEPEGLEVGKFGDQTYIFVMSERGSIVGVYQDTGAAPKLVQMLPSGIAPESAVAIPSRNIIATANEKDLVEDNAPRSHVMLFEKQDASAQYPQIVSQSNAAGQPIGWGALSGLAADLSQTGKLYAVSDSFYSHQPAIFTIDSNQYPARITHKLTVTRHGKPAEKLDLEGIAVDPQGGFWLASEGHPGKDVPHGIYHVTEYGEIDQTIPFPKQLLEHQLRFGAEGITQIDNTLWVAIQRPWKDDGQNLTKLLSYDLNKQTWQAVHYPLEISQKGWVGLSEITAHDGNLYVLERDNQFASSAKIKRLYKVALEDLAPVALGEELPTVTKTLVHDFLPELIAGNGIVVDKIEGFTFDNLGQAYAVTDNDGVDDSTGETYFIKLGQIK
ncbi:esterase-like activity of phytase family protein [Marinomonas epiphytica]